ncbi:MAG: tyrosine-type recombinase/integrase [Planctomycetes bacterium]|nr:tyrosine-type recombinase/integrase [Planctomycetota bacterium]MCG2684262.1 tyrosine-type recombinase/integrase [Planctomycetales bacterium]
MASISREPNGRRTVQFVGGDGKRRSIRLGKVSQREAEAVKWRVEALVSATLTGCPLTDEVSRWVATLDGPLADKLAKVGLVPKRQRAGDGLGLADFIDQYIGGRTDIKQSTREHLQRARRDLLAFFGPDKLLCEITPGDCDGFRVYLAERLAENTLRRICGRAKQFFRAAHRKRLIAENPFADMKGCGVQANTSRYRFITRAEAGKVLEACPDSQWRLLFALARFGGLRVPSEPLGLRWGDVDWAASRITIHSPKTAHQGKATRQIPFFPELRPHLEAAFDEAAAGTEYVITRYRDSKTNLRTQLERIIVKAGLEPWPKLWQNLRSTRETELAETYPMHVVTSWLGNTATVAAKHYLQVTDEHFQRAATGGAKAVQNPVQQAQETACKGRQQETQNPGFSGVCEPLRYCTSVQAPRQGLEPWT